MKRLILLVAAFVAVLSVKAEMMVYVTCADNSVQEYAVASLGDITFSADASQLFMATADGCTVTYPVAYVAAIEFEKPAGSSPVAFTTDFDVAFDAADDTSFDVVTETVPTKETDPAYGDFIEHYEDDEESKGTITITWNGSSASSSGKVKNVTVNISGADVTVVSAKKVDYVLKGSTTDGSFKLYTAKKSRIVLDNLSLHNTRGAAISLPKKTAGSGSSTVEYGGKTAFVELKGTSNLEDGTTYSAAIAGESMKATLFSEGQLIFSGNGTLNVKSNYGHGIASDDYVRIRGGKHNPVINVTTSNGKDGFSVNDYFLMYGGTVTINAADDGISVSKGYVDIAGGKLTVNASDEGIVVTNENAEAGIDPSITVRGGLLKINTSGDKGMALKAAANFTQTGGIIQAHVKGAGSKAFNTDGNMTFNGGKATALVDGLPIYDEEDNDVSSAAGIRCRGALTLNGANLAMKATANGGKGINVAGQVTVSAGNLTIVTTGSKYSSDGKTSRARGITADSGLTVSGGAVRVSSADDAVYTPATLTLKGGALHAFSKAETLHNQQFTHTAGWLVTR